MPVNSRNMTTELADFAINAKVSSSLTDVIRNAIVDCFGVIIAGARSQVSERAAKGLMAECHGKATIYGTGRTSSAPLAALLNSVAGHAFDLDDWEEPANTHPTVVLLPACLAAAHITHVCGQSLAAAYAVGFEVIARLGEALTLDHYQRGFHSTGTIGAIGAAAAVARLMKLDQVSTAYALSIAASQASGFTLQFGTNTKPLQAGFAARAGLEAACLAQAGATGALSAIDSRRGFAGLMGVAGRTLKRLGEPWALTEYGLLLKLWPSCGYTHRLMSAALILRPKVINRLDEITSIEVSLPDFHRDILPYDRPKSREEALFSLPACVAQTLVEGNLTLDDSANSFWTRPNVDRIIRLVKVVPEAARNPLLNFDPAQPDRLMIKLGDETLEHQCAYPLGAPQNPICEDTLAEKLAGQANITRHQFDYLLGWPDADDVKNFFDGALRHT